MHLSPAPWIWERDPANPVLPPNRSGAPKGNRQEHSRLLRRVHTQYRPHALRLQCQRPGTPERPVVEQGQQDSGGNGPERIKH